MQTRSNGAPWGNQGPLIWFVLVGLAAGAVAGGEERRPNILLIITDDQACDTLGAYGGRRCETPHLDQLAREGMVFHAAHHMGSWSGAVCSPSRRMIMTGRTVWRIPGSPAHGEPIPADLAQQSLPAVFKRAGYHTFRTCKVGNSYDEANAQFDERAEATKRGGDPAHGSAWHAEHVIDYLHERRESGAHEPFLVYLGFSHPHDPRHGPPELLAKYGAVDPGPPAEVAANAPPLPANYLPQHPFPIGHPDLRDEVAVEGVGKRRDEAAIRNELGKQYACIEDIDRQVGRVVEKLRAVGELDNTYIVFISDHGIAVGSHGLMGKQNLYEHSWRVPLIVRGPNVSPGSHTQAMVYLLDVLPTLCELAGISIPETVEGQSFAPVLRGEASAAREVVYGVYAGGTRPGIRAVKTGRWKLIAYDVLDGSVRRTQLFDLETNPAELLSEHHAPAVSRLLSSQPRTNQVNLAEHEQHAAIRARLTSLLHRESERYGDPFPIRD